MRILAINPVPNNSHPVFKINPPFAVKILFYRICKNSFAPLCSGVECSREVYAGLLIGLRLRLEFMAD